MALGKLATLPAAPGIEHVGHQQHVVEGGERDVVARQHQQVGLEVVPDLEHAAVLEQRLEPGERLAGGDLTGARPPPARRSVPARWLSGT